MISNLHKKSVIVHMDKKSVIVHMDMKTETESGFYWSLTRRENKRQLALFWVHNYVISSVKFHELEENSGFVRAAASRNFGYGSSCNSMLLAITKHKEEGSEIDSYGFILIDDNGFTRDADGRIQLEESIILPDPERDDDFISIMSENYMDITF